MIGFVIAEILLAIFSGGILTEVKWISTALAKMGKAGQFLMELINTVRKGMGNGKMARKVGLILETIEDVIANPKLLENKSLDYVRTRLKNSKGWVEGSLTKGRSKGKGWTFRQRNSSGTDFTDLYIQYFPGSPRHFNGKPYWKFSSGRTGDVRFVAK